MKTKQVLSLLCAAVMAATLSACGGESGNTSSTPSGNGSSEPSSTASFDKPQSLPHDGNSISDLGAAVTFDVTPAELIEDQSSLDSFKCDAYFLSDTVIGVFYSYAVETMPNYYEPRLDIAFYQSVSGSFGEDTQITYCKQVAIKPVFIACDGGFAVCSGTTVKTYTAEAFLAGGDPVFDTYEGDRLFDVCADETGKLIPLYANGNDLYIGKTKADSGLTSVMAGAIGNGGKTVLLADETTGVLLDGQGKKLASTDITALDRRINPFVTKEGGCFLGKLAGGNENLVAVSLTSDGTTTNTTVTEHLFDDYLANPYAGVRVEEADGTLYLIKGLAASNFDFGNGSVCILDGSFKEGETKWELPAAWYGYNNYRVSASGRLLVTENVADSNNEIKNYIHLF